MPLFRPTPSCPPLSRVGWPAAAFVVASSVAVAASAQPSRDASVPVQPLSDAISVQPGHTCLNEARLEARVARWLERDDVDARIRVEVFGGEGPRDVRFVVRRLGEEPAQRKLQSVPEPCDQLHAAVALSVALAIDAALLDANEVSDAEALGPAQDTGQPVPRHVEPPPDPNAFRPAFELELSAGFSSGLIPGEAPAGGLGGAFSPVRWLALRLGVVATGKSGLGFPEVPGNYTAWLAGGRLALCAVTVASERLAIDTCVGGALGVFGTRGDGGLPGVGQSDYSTWGAVLGGVAGALRLDGPLALALSVELIAPLQSRTTELLRDDGSVAAFTDLSPVGLAATLGFRYRLGAP